MQLQHLPILYIVTLAIALILERRGNFRAALLFAIATGAGMITFLLYGQEHQISIAVLLLRGQEEQLMKIGPVSFVLLNLLTLAGWLMYVSYQHGKEQAGER